MSERQGRIAIAAINAAEATQLAALHAAAFFSQALVSSPLFAARFMTQATVFAFGLVEKTPLARQPNDKLVKPPSNGIPAIPNAAVVTRIGDAVQTAVGKRVDDAPPAFVTTPDDAEKAAARKPIDCAAPALITKTDDDQKIELRAERLVIDKQPVQHSAVRVRKEIVTEIQSIDVPVSHEELVIDRYAVVTGDVDVEGAPIADETIRIPLTQEQVNITKETVVREEVEIGKRRIADVAHISVSVRHEELEVDDATTTLATPRVNPEVPVAGDDAPPAVVTAVDDEALALATLADDGAPALATGLDDASLAPLPTADAVALVPTADAAPPTSLTTTEQDQDQEIELRAERLVVNKQRGQKGKARVRKEIVREMKSIDVPVSHEELVIDRRAVTDDVDVDSAPIADETIRIPLTQEQVDVTKETVVREEVEIGKHRVEDVEHISDTVRHEELRVDDAPTNHYYEPAF